MTNGRKLALGVGTQDLLAISGSLSSFHRVRLETSAGFDRTITIKKRPSVDAGITVPVALAAWYKKESDGTIASAALAPGASNKSEYLLDGTAGVCTVEVSGGTAGTVDVIWTTSNS